MERELEQVILDWIREHFGDSEADDPCYNIYYLAQYLCEKFNIKPKDEEKYFIEGKI